MKNTRFNFIIKALEVTISILVFILPMQTYSQQDFFRGNGNDDLYYCCGSNNKRIICRFTEYGKKIDIKADFDGLIEYAEPTEGTLFGRMSSSIYRSTDAGLTFSPIATPSNRIYNIYGGNITGECIINTCTLVDWVVKNEQIYKSYDNGLTQILVKDSAHYLFGGHIGSVSGEFYYELFKDESWYLCHSLDFGATFDTIHYDPSIFQQTGRKFDAICPGTRLGEVYLVAKTATCPITDFYIYRSLDFGQTWNLQSEESFPCGDIMRYSCGREAGTFYILHEKESSSAQFLTLEIYASSDSGQTFSVYEHLLAHSLTVPENESIQSFSVWPNPAFEKISLRFQMLKPAKISTSIYNSLGTCVLQTTPEWQQVGEFVKTIDIKALGQGLYSVKLTANGEIIATEKLIITR